MIENANIFYHFFVKIQQVVSQWQHVDSVLETGAETHVIVITWWRHQREAFSELLALCAGNSPVPGEFPVQRPVTRSFDVFFDLRRINGWVNNREAGDLRRHHTHYDVFVMLGLDPDVWLINRIIEYPCNHGDKKKYVS